MAEKKPELNVLELVEAFNEAKRRNDNDAQTIADLEAKVRELEPIAARVPELEAELETQREFADVRGEAANTFAKERDDAQKAQAAAEKRAEKAEAAREAAEALVDGFKAEVDELKTIVDEQAGRLREADAFAKRALPVVEAADALRAALN